MSQLSLECSYQTPMRPQHLFYKNRLQYLDADSTRGNLLGFRRFTVQERKITSFLDPAGFEQGVAVFTGRGRSSVVVYCTRSQLNFSIVNG
ncbi:MAG: hypothetical protein LQ349_008979, partial [Xanthoria aureola]